MNLDKIALCLKKLGYEKLTEIQKKSLQEIAQKNKSVIIIAPTGSGKTEAAVFPVMVKIALNKIPPIAAIYITPLRALNRDIERRLNNIANCFGLNVGVRHGDTPSSIRKNIQHNPPHILITTPETFNYILINEDMKPTLFNLRYIIIDEFRDLIESKRGLLVLSTIRILERIIGREIGLIALSATLHNEELARRLLSLGSNREVVVIKESTPRRFEIQVSTPSCESELCRKINELLGDQALSARITRIFERAESEKHILVFTNTRSLAESLSTLMRSLRDELGLNLSIDVHHGSLSRQHREKVEREFRERKLNILVSTSSLELGIDIGHVEYVVQYMSPRQAIRLVQRAGRSRHRLGDVSRGEVITTSNLLHILESSVIAWRVVNSQLEKEVVISKPLDVLAYTIALLVYLHPNGIPVEQVFEFIREHPLYNDLTREEFNDVLDYLTYTRVVKHEGMLLTPTKKTRLYIYKTSMIPSTIDVQVIEAGTNKKVGVLDEEYVVVHLNPGDKIVLAGRPWKIINYDETERKLYVEPTEITEELSIPHWEGENIPVEYETAQLVGDIVAYIKNNNKLPEFIEKILEETNKSLEADIIKQLGDSKTITIDYIDEFDLIIINIYGGSKVNTLIRDIVKYVLKTQYPYFKVTSSSTTPYAIFLQVQKPITPIKKHPVDIVLEVFENIDKYIEGEAVERIAKESSQFLWRIYQVAQRFGAISPETTSVNKKLLEAFTDTVIGREALKEVLVKDYDITSFRELVRKIESGEVKVYSRKYSKLQDHHTILLSYIELPIHREIPVFDTSAFMERVLNRKISVICLRCGFYKEDRVREFLKMEKYTCPKCKGATLALVKGDISKTLEIVKKHHKGLKLTVEERRIHEDLVNRAVILQKHGDKALLALSIPGVGVKDAKKIINRVLSGEDLFKVLYEYEKRFLKIKKYLKEEDREKQSED